MRMWWADEIRNSVLEEAAIKVENTLTNQGDQYGACMVVSPDAEKLAEAVRSLKR